MEESKRLRLKLTTATEVRRSTYKGIKYGSERGT